MGAAVEETAAPAQLRMGTARGRWTLAATVIGSGITLLDSTVVGIALPKIGIDFGVGVASLQWLVTGYLLTLSSFLLVGGALGDRYGRRRVFTLGVIWFGIASALCAAAPNAGVLIVARALQGVGGALLTPGSLAILQSSFVPDDRGGAIGAWSGLGGLATAAGPLIGGLLLAVASWRWVFVINLPLCAAVVLISRRHVPESTDPTVRGRVDAVGSAWLVLGLAAVTYSLIEAPGRGWGDGLIVAGFGVGALAITGFVVTERRSRAPMVPRGLFASRQFNATNAVTFLVYGAMGAGLFLLPVALEQVAGYSPLEAGVSTLPVTALMLLFAARSGKLASRIGPRLQMSAGPVLIGCGLGLLALLTAHSFYPAGVLPGVLLLGVGLVVTVAPLTATAMGAAPADHAGLASAVNNDVARVAGLIAVAIVPVVSSLTGDAYLHPAVFAQGFRIGCVICGVTSILGGMLAAVTIRNPRRATPPTPIVAPVAPPQPAYVDCGQQGGPGVPPVQVRQ